MPSLDVALAIQFDKATLGLTVSAMRDQILGNIESMSDPHRPALHYIHGLHPVPSPSYNVILSEHEYPATPLLQYQAAVICSDADGIRIVLHGSKEATVWAAYRSLMRITMREVGRMTSARSNPSEFGGCHRRVASAVSRDSGVAGMGGGCGAAAAAARDTESDETDFVLRESFSVLGHDKDGYAESDRHAMRKAKSLKVLGLEGTQ